MIRKIREKVRAWWKARKRWQQILIAVGGVLVGLWLLWMAFMMIAYPTKRPVDLVFEVDRTPPAISRGEYLYHAVADCAGCHTRRDFTFFGGPHVGDLGAGFGDVEEGGLQLPLAELPGEIYPRNITMDRETGLGEWRDDEMVRAIRDGVSRDGSPLFPTMRYLDFAVMSDTDVQAIVAYIRLMPAIPKAVPRSNVDFPTNFLFRTIPTPVTEAIRDINRQDRLDYGEYLARIGGCVDCHTPGGTLEPEEGMLLAGGRSFQGARYHVFSANLTPDPQTGLRLGEDEFVARFKRYEQMAKGLEEIPPASPRNQTFMPWLAMSGMNDSDLRTIYGYLKQVRPVRNQVATRPGR